MARTVSDTLNRSLLDSNSSAVGKAPAMAPAAPHNGTLAVTEPVRRGSFNPILAIVVSTMIISFFLVGFATGYFKRWIRNAELENEEIIRRRLSQRSTRRALKPQPGLDPQIIASLPLVQYEDLPADQQAVKYFDCAVCLAGFDPTDSLRMLPLCTHAFHSDCIDEWFLSHTTCPLCRLCLAHPIEKAASGGDHEGRFAEDDIERGGIRVPADFDVVEVVVGRNSSDGSSISGNPQADTTTPMANTSPREDHAGPVSCSLAWGSCIIPVIRVDITSEVAAATSIRRSSSVGSDLQLRQAGYVVNSEGTQHHRNFPVYAIANQDGRDGDQAQTNESPTLTPATLGEYWTIGASSHASGSVSNKVVLQSGPAGHPQRVWSTRWSFPNLRQISPI